MHHTESAAAPRPLSTIVLKDTTMQFGPDAYKTGSIRDLYKHRCESDSHVPTSTCDKAASLNRDEYLTSMDSLDCRSAFPHSQREHLPAKWWNLSRTLSLSTPKRPSYLHRVSDGALTLNTLQDDIDKTENTPHDSANADRDHAVDLIPHDTNNSDYKGTPVSPSSTLSPFESLPQSLHLQIPARCKQAHVYFQCGRYQESLTECKHVLLHITRLDLLHERHAAAKSIMSTLRRLGQRDLDAQFILASTYMYGVSEDASVVVESTLPPFLANEILAFHAYLSAAKRGHIEAMFKISEMYSIGMGTSQSHRKSIYYLRKAAIKNHPEAMKGLGLAMINGGPGQVQRLRDGVVWLRMACRFATREYPGAIYCYAELHMNGLSDVVFRDDSYVVELLTKGAELDHLPCIFKLAEAFEHGWFGLERHPHKSFESYSRAAELGHSEAMFELSRRYLVGASIEQDGFHIGPCNDKAFSWMLRSAEAGYQRAIFGMGHFHHQGLGTSPNTDLAMEWYHKAAILGERGAIEMVAELAGDSPIPMLHRPRRHRIAKYSSMGSLSPPTTTNTIRRRWTLIGRRATSMPVITASNSTGTVTYSDPLPTVSEDIPYNSLKTLDLYTGTSVSSTTADTIMSTASTLVHSRPLSSTSRGVAIDLQEEVRPSGSIDSEATGLNFLIDTIPDVSIPELEVASTLHIVTEPTAQASLASAEPVISTTPRRARRQKALREPGTRCCSIQ
ncbi:hypothetical protein BSLG_004784 [Batrachochytrium salamandrivorans]|nr:hypothetical protein BSLG_004784 [Batrachochytrium salamandrivorans]